MVVLLRMGWGDRGGRWALRRPLESSGEPALGGQLDQRGNVFAAGSVTPAQVAEAFAGVVAVLAQVHVVLLALDGGAGAELGEPEGLAEVGGQAIEVVARGGCVALAGRLSDVENAQVRV